MSKELYAKLAAQATQDNDHNGALKFIAMYVVEKHNRLSGVHKLIKNMDALITLHEMYNCMTPALHEIRNDLRTQIFSFLSDRDSVIISEKELFNKAL